ncbi:MAG TPA: type ISP restriction/modification enzyme, partial [Nannocystis sp.]
MTPQALARSLAAVARGLRRALQRRLLAERRAGAGAVLEIQHEVARELVTLDDREFADAWAQTLVYLLLAARWLAPGQEPAEHLPQRLARCDARLGALVARLLKVTEVQALQRALAGVTLVHAEVDDPVMHFYEAFLAAYDPRLRAARGVYFTPAPVVDYLVETTDAVLRDRLGLSEGLADATSWGEYARRRGISVPPGVEETCPFVQVVDPAAGTGTFVIAVIRRAHATMLARWGEDPAAWSEYVHTRLLPRLRGVERMIAPWAIAVLRLSMLLAETGVEGTLATPVFILGDTLAGPDLLPGPISVVLGNPPYERERPQAPGGGWIREGTGRALLADFVEPARAAGAGAHVKNLYNLYVYFWRWACWQVFERRPQAPGVVAMVTGASFLKGPGFVGMRAHMRRWAPKIHVLDLEGDRRGANLSDNVFAVSVPVAATTLLRDLSDETGVEIHRAQGSSADKLELCARTRRLDALAWMPVRGELAWIADEVSAGFHAWPKLTDLFPWQHSGAQWKRTWPIAADPEVLARRWATLMRSEARGELFHETRDRSTDGQYPPLRGPGLGLAERTGEAISECEGVMPPVRRYGFRALDRRYCLADARLGDFLRPALWWIAGGRQVFLTSLLTGALGPGPAAMVSVEVPDLHYFCGRGGKDV